MVYGCFILSSKYWERFADELEETQVLTIFKACSEAKARKVIFTTYEDVGKLTQRAQKSQIISYGGDRIKPKFDGMKDAKEFANSLNIQVTHMITSYLDQVSNDEKMSESLHLSPS